MLQRSRPCHSLELRAPRIYSLTVQAVVMRNDVLYISAFRFFTSFLLFFSLKFPDSLQKRSPACSQAIHILGAQEATDSTALALRRLARVKPLAGYIGLEKRKTIRPAVHEMIARTCSRQENLLLSPRERQGYAKTISANEVVVRLTVGC